MNLIFRLILVILGTSFSRRRASITETVRSRFRAWIGDHDPMGHVGRPTLSAFAELATFKWLLTTGLLNKFRENNWVPIVIFSELRFLRALRFPDKFEVDVDLIGYDDRLFCLRLSFIRNESLIGREYQYIRVATKKNSPAANLQDLFSVFDPENSKISDAERLSFQQRLLEINGSPFLTEGTGNIVPIGIGRFEEKEPEPEETDDPGPSVKRDGK